MTTLDQKYALIRELVLQQESKDPIFICKLLMHEPYISIHGPEHHFLDGAAFLVAFKNAGGRIDIERALDELASRSRTMPGAMCGYWGVCGSTSSIGACFSIINKTGPLSDNQFYKDNMEYTSSVINVMSKIGGPRCCKRNAFTSISQGVKFAKEKYGVIMDLPLNTDCEFSSLNEQCIKERCPYYRNK